MKFCAVCVHILCQFESCFELTRKPGDQSPVLPPNRDSVFVTDSFCAVHLSPCLKKLLGTKTTQDEIEKSLGNDVEQKADPDKDSNFDPLLLSFLQSRNT